ncbi:hypothetical protein GCM10027286_03870 [Virgibacillus ainsalahensis]
MNLLEFRSVGSHFGHYSEQASPYISFAGIVLFNFKKYLLLDSFQQGLALLRWLIGAVGSRLLREKQQLKTPQEVVFFRGG